ncbi:EpsG family protein [Bacteroides fragilis]
MIPYAFIILLVVFFSVFDFSNLNVFKKKILLFFLSFILILFVGTRFETGDDWGEYTKVFDKIPLVSDLWNDNGMFLLFRMEPGYILFNSVIKSFGGSINEVFLLSSIVVISLFFVFQKRYTLLPFLAVLLYMRYGYMQFNMMFVRQGIAISIFFYSLKYIEDKKIIKYLLINILSSLFHSSLLIVLPLYFVINRRYSNIFFVYSCIYFCTIVFL